MTNGCKSILFYNDAAEFGGHEVMTLEAVRYLSSRRDLKVSFAFYEGNERLLKRLEDIKNSSGNLALKPLPFRSKSLQAFRSLVTWIKTMRIEGLMKRVDPDVVVISQGRIEGSSLGLLAAKRAGFRTISYIPLAHPVSVSGKPFALWLREKVNGYFYRLPDKIITISEGARQMLLARGTTPDVVGVVGRIEFRQKGQDFAVRAVARYKEDLKNFRFLFVGSGPDEARLAGMIVSLGVARHAQVLPWHPNPAEVYSGIEMLLIPSKFEGVPLTMLEAMARELPVIASNVDGMAEILPQSWLFPYGDCAALVDTLRRVRNSDNATLLETNRKRVTSEFSTANFCLAFARAVLQ